MDKMITETVEETDYSKIPSRIKYYILDWKDKNLEAFVSLFGDVKLHQLNKDQLYECFGNAFRHDFKNK